jgi:hypothetical protein
MVFVLKRTPAFQLFGPFQEQSQAMTWVKQHANERRYACCILEPIDPRQGEVTKSFVAADAPRGKNTVSINLRFSRVDHRRNLRRVSVISSSRCCCVSLQKL